jgi:hypothetical protein
MTVLVRDTSPLILQLSIDQLKKLRQTTRVDSESQFPNYVLLRVVRLTIETNMLTGIYPLINPLSTFVHVYSS